MLPTDRHRWEISSKEAVLPAGTMMRRWAPPTRYTLQLNTASIMKDLINTASIMKDLINTASIMKDYNEERLIVN